MAQAIQVFVEYAAAFEETYVDDNWERLIPYFAEDASYEIRGGPMACMIHGREAIFTGLKKSLDSLDRRCSDRKIALTDGPETSTSPEGEVVSMGWRVDYQYKDAPPAGFAGRSVVIIANGVIVALRDEYEDQEMVRFGEWVVEHAPELDGSYV